MANVQIAGFQPVARGGATVETARMRVLTNNTDPIAKGDALDWPNDGSVIAHSTEAGEVYSVQWGGASYVDAATGDRIGRKVLPAATLYTSSGVNPANASYVFGVTHNESQEYRASIDEAVTLTDLNINFQMVLTVATGENSLHELDATSKATTATIPWRFISFDLGDLKSDPGAADAACIVMINAGIREPALESSGSLGI